MKVRKIWTYPKHLDRLEHSLLGNSGRKEGDDDGNYVDGKLELKELSDGVVDIPAPFNSAHNGHEVVLGK